MNRSSSATRSRLKTRCAPFCQNPGGFVSQENYDNNLAVVNGHSYKDKKSDNTNLAILCSHNFNEPFNQPIEYAQKVGELTNMLANGTSSCSALASILDGKRTWAKELAESNVKPTLAGRRGGRHHRRHALSRDDQHHQLHSGDGPRRAGFASYETLLYSPELKFYSNRIRMDADLNTSIEGLHCLGDSSGWTRGLMMASCMGVLMAASSRNVKDCK